MKMQQQFFFSCNLKIEKINYNNKVSVDYFYF